MFSRYCAFVRALCGDKVAARWPCQLHCARRWSRCAPKPAVLLTRPVGKGATQSYDFIRVSETVVCGYNTSIFLAGFSFADSFLGITTWSTPLSYLAEIPSLSTVLGKWNERQKDW